MRAMWGLAGLVVVLAVVGLGAQKQLSAVRAPAPLVPGASAVSVGSAASAAATVQQQSQQIQEQVRQQVDGLMQQERPMPEDAK